VSGTVADWPLQKYPINKNTSRVVSCFNKRLFFQTYVNSAKAYISEAGFSVYLK